MRQNDFLWYSTVRHRCCLYSLLFFWARNISLTSHTTKILFTATALVTKQKVAWLQRTFQTFFLPSFCRFSLTVFWLFRMPFLAIHTLCLLCKGMHLFKKRNAHSIKYRWRSLFTVKTVTASSFLKWRFQMLWSPNRA